MKRTDKRQPTIEEGFGLKVKTKRQITLIEDFQEGRFRKLSYPE
jgi:hypothetical protein